MHFKYSVLAASMAAALAITGCNGGSDSSANESSKVVDKGGVVITAMDGYLKNALVCVDYDEKLAAENKEPSDGACTASDIFIGVTKDRGEITVPADKKAALDKGPLLVQTIIPGKAYTGLEKLVGGIFTIDEDFPFEPMTKDVTFRAPQGSKIINPITDLVASKIEAGNTKEEAEKAVITKLQEDLGLDNVALYDNYVAAGKNGDTDAKKLHKTAQILTNTQAKATENGIENIDAVLDEVVTTAAAEVKDMSESELKSDAANSVSVDITKNGEELAAKDQVETDVKTLVIEQAHTELQDTLNAHEFKNKYLEVFETQLQPLFKKGEAELKATQISNEADLKEKGIKASITESNLRIEAIEGTSIQAGTYTLKLTDAEKSATTFFEFKVDTFQSAPTVVEEAKAELQQKISGLTLQAKVDMGTESFNISALFEDKDGDQLTVTVLPGTSGLNMAINGDQLEISGTPSVSGDFIFSLKVKDTTDNQVSVDFKLPTIAEAPITNNPLSDLLIGKTLYRFNADWTKQSDNQYTAKADCWAIRLTEDKKVLEAEMTDGQCPAENSEFTETGTWVLKGDDIAVSLNGEGTSILSLNKDESAAELARVHLLSTSAKISDGKTISSTEPVTFYIGEQVAKAYWSQPEAHIWVNDQELVADAHSQSRSEHEPNDKLDADLFFNISCEKLGFEKDDFGNSSYRWTSNVPYNFYLLNSKFTNGMFKADTNAIGFAFGYTDECAIDFDYTQQTTIAPGESVVVLAEPRDGFNAEEFIVNTVVDRNDTIEPQASLDIDEQGIFIPLVEDSALIRLYKDGDKIIEQEMGYIEKSGEWSEWKQTNTNVIAYQYDNNTLYQVSEPATEGNHAESFTVWTNDNQSLLFLDAGKELCMDGENHDDSCATPNQAPYYTDEASAKQTLEETLNQPITFKGNSWYVTYESNPKENYTITFFDDKITASFDQSEPGESSEDEISWDQVASVIGVPACVADDSCTVTSFNTMVEACDMDGNWTFEECDTNKKYHRYWSYNTEDDSITERKIPVIGGDEHASMSTWTKK